MNKIAGILGRVFGRSGFGAGPREAERTRQFARPIPGASAAPELCMRPVDATIGTLRGGIVQLKADGYRSLKIDDMIVTQEGTPMDCAIHCLPGLDRLEDAFGRKMVFDGEYVEEDGFEATATAFKRGWGEGVFWVFDAVPLEEWVTGRFTMPLEDRLDDLRRLIPASEIPFVGMLDHCHMTPAQAAAKARELWALGYEGIVEKDPGSLYQRRRSGNWRRLKEVVTADVLITDVFEKNGRLKLICKDPASPLPPITVTNGWSQAEFAELTTWASMTADDKRWIEIAYNRKAGSARPRHARFVRIRRDKKGSKS